MPNEIQELLEGYGYSIFSEDRIQRQRRFKNENGFVDVWNSKKGITIGVYNPESKRVSYRRRCSVEELEKMLIKIKN